MTASPVGKLVVRVIEIVFSLITWACAAYLVDKGAKESRIDFMLFTGFTAFLIAIFYVVVSFVNKLQDIFCGLVEIISSAIYALFFMAAFSAYFDWNYCEPGEFGNGSRECDAFLTSAAFAILSWLLWIVSIIFAVLDFRGGKGLLTSGGAQRQHTEYTGGSVQL